MLSSGRKHKVKKKQNADSDLRADVRRAIDRLFPDGLIEMAIDDESYFHRIYPKLSPALHAIDCVRFVMEREPQGGAVWYGHSDPDEDPPDEDEHSRSYHLFFVCPKGEAFSYETEIESLDGIAYEYEDDDEQRIETVAGQGYIGWSVAVSLLARFAVITLGDKQSYEDGSVSEPSIEPHAFTEEGRRIHREEEFRKSSPEAFETLLKLRGAISDVLTKHRMVVLPQEEWQKPAPGLRADEEVLVGMMGEPIRVLDAFFFEAF